jgi:hypothetical protein
MMKMPPPGGIFFCGSGNFTVEHTPPAQPFLNPDLARLRTRFA